MTKSHTEYLHEANNCLAHFSRWPAEVQVQFVGKLLGTMTFHQHGQVEEVLRPLLMRDFITDLSDHGLSHLVERILLHLDAVSLRNAEQVSPSWSLAIARGYLWKRLLEQRICNNPLWLGLIQKLDFARYFRLPSYLLKRTATPSSSRWNGGLVSSLSVVEEPQVANGTPPLCAESVSCPLPTVSPSPPSRSCRNASERMILRSPNFYRSLFQKVEDCIENVESNWRQGKCKLRAIQCHSEGSKGVYCIQYDEDKIISGLRDNTIKVWDLHNLQCQRVLRGHSGSVLCLQYDDDIIISGSSDSTVRVWRMHPQWECVHILQHHSDAVLHLRFDKGILVTCSKDRTISVWNMVAPTNITLTAILQGHRAAVNVIDFDHKYIVSASGDRTIKVWSNHTYTLVRTLTGHKRGIACLQYHDQIIVSGSSDNSIRIWDVESSVCQRVLEGHKELVRCIRFDARRIVSGSYDGEIKVWDMEAALSPHTMAQQDLCLQTLTQHTGRVFRLQFDDMKIVSSSHDDSILIWDFGPTHEELQNLALALEDIFCGDVNLMELQEDLEDDGEDECASISQEGSTSDCIWVQGSPDNVVSVSMSGVLPPEDEKEHDDMQDDKPMVGTSSSSSSSRSRRNLARMLMEVEPASCTASNTVLMSTDHELESH